MNIFLVPYTWMRHLNVGLVCIGAGLLAWWLSLWLTMTWGTWGAAVDGPLYLGLLSTFVAAASVLAEMSLSRAVLWKRVALPALAAAIAAPITVGWALMWAYFIAPTTFGDDGGNPSLVSLRYHLAPFIAAGLATAVGTLAPRKARGFFAHMTSGLAAGLVAGAVWYITSYPKSLLFPSDLYLAGAAGAASFGAVFGLGAWEIPDSLYAGWLRVVSDTRHGRRIPIDAADGAARERFVGHYLRGLDLYLPEAEGVAELHVSVVVDSQQRYRLRGLTLAPTRVRRFLESVDLRYDPRRPAPLETRLASGDRIVLGTGKQATVVEFLMLPREER